MQDLRVKKSNNFQVTIASIKDNALLTELEKIVLSFIIDSDLSDSELMTQAKM